ncbi:MAG: GHKL domain-containing protein [Acidobacteria bacterium]|nr:GHKL domain-containing protein [Acidobacteriota bacterium]
MSLRLFRRTRGRGAEDGAVTPAERPGLRFQQQYVLAAGVFALAVVAIILLFGHLISRSLSKRYLEDVLVAGREDARQLAKEMSKSGGANVYDVIEKNREVLQQHVVGLAQKLIFQSITVTDKNGKVVYRASFRSQESLPANLVAKELDVGGNLTDQVVKETQNSYQIPAPIGKVGEVILSVSKGKLAARVVRLRRQLLRQTITVAAATLLTLIGGFFFVWHLVERTRRLEASRKEAEELATLGSLAANLAHEIRNPLNSITLNLEMLEEDLRAEPPETRESLVSTRREVGRLSRLMTDFLTYARPQGTLREPVRLAPLLRNLETFLRAEARAVNVHLRVAKDLPDVTIHGDEGQLRQVLINLVLNGIQAVKDLEPARRVVELIMEVEGNEISLAVRDRGDGVPEEDLGRIREAFYTRRPGGTGLGLAVAERVARNHGGRLTLKNLDSQGFEARLVLPLPEEDVKIGAV